MKNNKKSTTSSATLRALRILDVVASSEKSMTPTEINQYLGLPSPSIHRICLMLEKEGYLQNQIDGKGLLPGTRLKKIAIKMFSNNDHFKYEHHAILQNLSNEIGETSNISIPDGLEMVYYDRVETHWPFRMQMKPNDRVPIYCTASGKLYLSTLSSAKKNRILSNLKIEKLTTNTITDIDELKHELKKIKKTSVGIDNEEFMQGMIAISVPLITEENKFIGALAVHAPKARLSLEDALDKTPLLQKAAKKIIESLESSAR